MAWLFLHDSSSDARVWDPASLRAAGVDPLVPDLGYATDRPAGTWVDAAVRRAGTAGAEVVVTAGDAVAIGVRLAREGAAGAVVAVLPAFPAARGVDHETRTAFDAGLAGRLAPFATALADGRFSPDAALRYAVELTRGEPLDRRALARVRGVQADAMLRSYPELLRRARTGTVEDPAWERPAAGLTAPVLLVTTAVCPSAERAEADRVARSLLRGAHLHLDAVTAYPWLLPRLDLVGRVRAWLEGRTVRGGRRGCP